VSNSGSAKSELLKRYSGALFALAEGQKILPAVTEDLRRIHDVIEKSASLKKALSNPLYDKKSVASAVVQIIRRIGANTMTQQFVTVLSANGRLFLLPEFYHSFKQMLAEKNGEVQAHITSATPLSAAQKKNLTKGLESATGKKIELEEIVDPAILGGLIVKLGSKMVDDSIDGRIERLKRHLKTSELTLH
jgi:F-type H+-transporting ATPase subunit delta